jgi:hypothetical protein
VQTRVASVSIPGTTERASASTTAVPSKVSRNWRAAASV